MFNMKSNFYIVSLDNTICSTQSIDFLYGPGPIIVYACQWLTNSLSHEFVENWMNWSLLTKILNPMLMHMLRNMQNMQNIQIMLNMHNMRNMRIMQNSISIPMKPWKNQPYSTKFCKFCMYVAYSRFLPILAQISFCLLCGEFFIFVWNL